MYCANTNGEGGEVNEKSHCLKVAFSFKIYNYNNSNTGLFIIVGKEVGTMLF